MCEIGPFEGAESSGYLIAGRPLNDHVKGKYNVIALTNRGELGHHVDEVLFSSDNEI